MNINLFLGSFAFGILIFFTILYLLKKQKITIKYALIWIVIFFLLFIALIIPGFMDWITNKLGFQTPSNMVLSLLSGALIVISISLTVALSAHEKKIRLLIQEVSLLKKEVQEKND